MTSSTPKRRWRARLREIMEPYRGDETSTWLSLVIDIVLVLAIVASCLVVVAEHLHGHPHRWFTHVELGFSLFFMVEYLLRWLVAENRWRYPFTLTAVIDLIAILPGLFFLSTDLLLLRAVREIRLLSLLRVLRLVRLLKLFRFGHLLWRGLVHLRIWWSAANDQYRLTEIGRLLLVFGVAWFVSVNLIHLYESSLSADKSSFARYGEAYWSVFVNLTSGIQKDPLSLGGRVIMTGTIFFALCWLALFTGQIVTMIVRRSQRVGKVALKPPRARLAQHVIILGVNRHLDGLLKELHAATGGHHWVLVVAPEAEDLPVTDPHVYRRVFALAKDPVRPEVLAELQLESAWRVIVLATDPPGDDPRTDDRTLMETLAVYCRRQAVPMVVQLRECETEDTVRWLEAEGIEFVTSQRIGQSLLCQAALNPGISEVYGRLLTFVRDPTELFLVSVPAELVGKTFAEAQFHFLEASTDEVTLIGLDRSPADWPGSQVILNPVGAGSALPEEARVLRGGDHLLVISCGRPAFARTDLEALWSGKVLHRT